MNRIDRVTAILIQLQSKRVVKAQEIADRFGMSLRTVYRDIKTLEEAGIPLIGEAGVGYSIADGYRLPPVMFTKEEATAFLTAEKLISKLTDDVTAEQFKSAMYKVKAVLRSADKNTLEGLDDHIEVIDRITTINRPQNNLIQALLKCIADKSVTKIDYFAMHNEADTQRNIEPIGIYYLGSNWHLIAWCRMRNDYRNFRVDRIRKLIPLEERYNTQHPNLKEYLAKVSVKDDLKTAVVLFDKNAAKYTDEQKYYAGFVSERTVDEGKEITFLVSDINGLARWLLMFGNQINIISPQELKTEMSKMVTQLQKHLI